MDTAHKCKYCDRRFDKLQSKGAHQKWCNPETRPDLSGENNPMWGKSNKGTNQWATLDWASVPFDNLGWNKKRAFLLKECNNSCSMCGFNETRPDGTIILQIDHINGDRKDNSRDNLRVLCPNCHAVHSDKFMHIGQHHSEDTKHRISETNTGRRIPSVS